MAKPTGTGAKSGQRKKTKPADMRSFSFPSGDLNMPSAVAGDEDGWRDRLRHYYVTGQGGADDTAPLLPAALRGVLDAGDQWRRYPLLRAGADVGPLHRVVFRAVERAVESGADLSTVAKHIERFVRAVGAVHDERPEAPLSDVLASAGQRFVEEFGASEEAAEALGREVALLSEFLPRAGALTSLSEQTLLFAYLDTIGAAHRKSVDALRARVQTLSNRLGDLIKLDDARGPNGRDPSKLAAAMGGGSEFFDPAAMAKAVPNDRGPAGLSKSRRERIEGALAALGKWLDDEASRPTVIAVHPGTWPETMEIPGVRVVRDADSTGTALNLFAELMGSTVELARAVRVAQLEVVGEYDAALHDMAIARLTWEAMGPDEMLFAPRIVALETVPRLLGGSLASFSALLRSGRPIHVLVADQVTSAPTDPPLLEQGVEIGQLATAHREAFVLQATLARPDHLARGLERMARSNRPALAIVAVPTFGDDVPPWVQLATAHEARLSACYVYDPDGGASWAHRFELGPNPQLEGGWPVHQVSYTDGGGATATLTEPFTAAHFGALDPGSRRHLWIIPPEAWSDEQVPAAELLERSQREPVLGVPFVWVVDGDGRLSRAVITSALLSASRDRMRAWRVIQELGGTNNEHARRAAEAARLEALDEAAAEREALEQKQAAELERVRAEAAAETIDRLAHVLMDLDSVPVSVPAARAPAPPTAPAAPEAAGDAVAAPEPAAEEDDDVSFDEAYLDTALCTTCNECTNINPRMFKYNGDNQAEIADVSVGTFLELVKAAEKCPARCIHPGAPQAGDDTANDDLIKRAAPFN